MYHIYLHVIVFVHLALANVSASPSPVQILNKIAIILSDKATIRRLLLLCFASALLAFAFALSTCAFQTKTLCQCAPCCPALFASASFASSAASSTTVAVCSICLLVLLSASIIPFVLIVLPCLIMILTPTILSTCFNSFWMRKSNRERGRKRDCWRHYS